MSDHYYHSHDLSRFGEIGDGVVYSASDDGAIYALDAATGEERWHFTTGDATGISPALVGRVLYFPSSDRTLYAVLHEDREEGLRLYHDAIDLLAAFQKAPDRGHQRPYIYN